MVIMIMMMVMREKLWTSPSPGFLEFTWQPRTPSALDHTLPTLDCHRFFCIFFVQIFTFFYIGLTQVFSSWLHFATIFNHTSVHKRKVLYVVVLMFLPGCFSFSFSKNILNENNNASSWVTFDQLSWIWKDESRWKCSRFLRTYLRIFSMHFWQELKEQ